MNHLNIVDMDNAIEELRKERDEAIVKCERLSELNNKLTEDFNTLALDRSQWQERAEKASLALAAEQAINKDLRWRINTGPDLTTGWSPAPPIRARMEREWQDERDSSALTTSPLR